MSSPLLLPTRFSVNGERRYRTDDPDKAYHSVTTILGKTAGAKAQQALRSWRDSNPGAAEAAAARGNALHAGVENYIRGKDPCIPDAYKGFWNVKTERALDNFDEFLWSEKPLQPGWEFCTGHDGIHRIWSHAYQYAGCPDIIAGRKGRYFMADAKSSNGRYCRSYPRGNNRELFTGWRKFEKCAMQIAAYAIAAQEILGIEIDRGLILVLLEYDDPQIFELKEDEMYRYKQKWLQRVATFQKMLSVERLALEGKGDGAIATINGTMQLKDGLWTTSKRTPANAALSESAAT